MVNSTLKIKQLLKETFLSVERLNKIATPYLDKMRGYGYDSFCTLDSNISFSGVPLHSAVAIVLNDKNQILLGRSTDQDDRNGTLCFLGGGIDNDEGCGYAAIREAWEEAGIDVEAELINPNCQGGVAFVICKYVDGEINHNNEFSEMNWYDLDFLPWKDIYYKNIGPLKHIISLNKK